MPQNVPVTQEALDELRQAIFERIQEMEARFLRAQELSRMFDQDNEIGRRNNHLGHTEDDIERFVQETRTQRSAASRLG